MGQCQQACSHHCQPCTSPKNVLVNPEPKAEEFMSDQKRTETNDEGPPLKDYTLAANLPSQDQAVPMTQQEQTEFLVSQNILKQMKKLGPLMINEHIPENVKKLPASQEPYKLEWLKAVYVGQWRLGKPYGMGIMYYDDQTVHEGYFKQGIPDGTGRRFYPDRSYILGTFKEGLLQGKGKLVQSNGFTYNGTWLDNKPHGSGEEHWPNGTKYIGAYKAGKKDGYGTFIWMVKQNEELKEEIYQGNFKDDLFDGRGRYEWVDGRMYDGLWKAGKMDGQGFFRWADGRTYEGEYLMDHKHGQGTFTWPDGKKWEGLWTLGKMHGIGIIKLPNGRQRVGEWVDGKRVRWMLDYDQLSVFSNITNKFEVQTVNSPSRHNDDI